MQRRVKLREPARLHQIASGEQFIRGHDAAKRFAGNTHEPRRTGASADEYGMEPHLLDHLFNGEQAPYECVAFNPNPQLFQVVDFRVDHGIGQTKFRDAITQDTARDLQRLINHHLATRSGQIRRTRHSRRPGPDNGDAKSIRRDGRSIVPALLDRMVAHPAFQPSHGHRLQRLAHGADRLTLALLRTYAAANGRQQIVFGQNLISAPVIALANLPDERGNVRVDRTAGDALGVDAHQATLTFAPGILQRVAQSYGGEIPDPLRRRLLGHRGPLLGNGSDRLRFHVDGSWGWAARRAMAEDEAVIVVMGSIWPAL